SRSTTIDGAPITYMIAFAAATAVFSFIPISVAMASGGAFPMSQGINPLVGIILGPIAGAITSLIGTSVGVILAPHTAGIPALTLMGATVSSFIAGCFVRKGPRAWWFVPVALYSIINYIFYAGRAVFQNGVEPWIAIVASIISWSSLLIFILPTRRFVAKFLTSENITRLSIGFFLVSWTASSLGTLSQAVIAYWMLNWPEEVWIFFIPVLPYEAAVRSIVGVVIGAGIVTGMRSTGMMKPRNALY
ncbi:MAG: hypothetical protein AAF546_02595, partial [Verrucomicrobiota bacterium]